MSFVNTVKNSLSKLKSKLTTSKHAAHSDLSRICRDSLDECSSELIDCKSYANPVTKSKTLNPEDKFAGVQVDNDVSRALNIQVGGGHYKQFTIQPIEYIFANKIGYAEGNVIKYISRWKFKNGIEDLKKARHYIDLLIESEEDDS